MKFSIAAAIFPKRFIPQCLSFGSPVCQRASLADNKLLCDTKYINLTANKGSFLITLSFEGARVEDSEHNICSYEGRSDRRPKKNA